jgi:hypothetical protein
MSSMRLRREHGISFERNTSWLGDADQFVFHNKTANRYANDAVYHSLRRTYDVLTALRSELGYLSIAFKGRIVRLV